MESSNTRPAWMDDELVKDIDPRKLDFISRISSETQGRKSRSQKEMMMQLMPLLKKAKQENLTFSPTEMSAAIQAIRKYSTAEEQAHMDQVLKEAQQKGLPPV